MYSINYKFINLVFMVIYFSKVIYQKLFVKYKIKITSFNF